MMSSMLPMTIHAAGVTSSHQTAKLPNLPFEFFFNASNYDEATHSITNHPDARLAGYNLQLTGEFPEFDGEMLSIRGNCEGYITKWPQWSTESGNYFFRQGQDCMTIIAKVKPMLDLYSCDFISNRGGGYNYMFRIDNNGMSGVSHLYLHTADAYSEERSLTIATEDEQVLAARANGKENYIQIDNLTTGETLRYNGVNWGGGNNIFNFFNNCRSEYFHGGFYWAYYSFELLNDDQVEAVINVADNEAHVPEFTDAQGLHYTLDHEANTAVIDGHADTVRDSIVIPQRTHGCEVVAVTSKALAGVTDIKSVTVTFAEPIRLDADAFEQVAYESAKLLVPYEAVDAYKNTAGWNKFRNITFYPPMIYTDDQGLVYNLNENERTYTITAYQGSLPASITIPSTCNGLLVKSIQDDVFHDATSLKSVTLNEGLYEIGSNAFRNTGLTAIDIPNSVEYIHPCAFNDNEHLVRAFIGSGVRSMHEWGNSTFAGCPKLEAITVSSENGYYSSYNGMLFNKAQTMLFDVPGIKTTFEASDFPPLLTTISARAMENQTSVRRIVLPPSVTIVDDISFGGCINLESLSILAHATLISGSILRDCSNIKDVYLRGYYPDRVLSSEEFLNTVSSTCTVHVPKGMTKAYQDILHENKRNLNIVDDQPLPSVIDWDYTQGFNKMDVGMNAPRLEVGLVLTKEEAAAYKGCRITGVHACTHPWDESEMYAFVAKKPGGEHISETRVLTPSFDGWAKVMLEEPYTITGDEDIFIGFGHSTSAGISYSIGDPKGRLWFNWSADGNNWQPWSEGNLALGFTIEGGHIPANLRFNSAELLNVGNNKYNIKGQVESILVGIANGYDLAYTIDGGEKRVWHSDEALLAKQPYDFSIELPNLSSGLHTVEIWADLVNNIKDGLDADSHETFTVDVSGESYTRRVVVEEGTGTWCGFCPRGIVGIRTMIQNHPDNFIAIAIHDEEMAAPSYVEFCNRFGGFPACTVDRKFYIDPNADELENCYQKEFLSAIANVTINRARFSPSKNSVSISTTSRFGYDMTDDFRIAYVVTEDKVGPYNQRNLYAGGSKMGGFENMSDPALILHDHVARSISDINGTEGTVPLKPKGMTDYHYTYNLTLPDNIQTLENISIICLLINQQTGEVANADIIPYTDILMSDIDTQKADVNGDGQVGIGDIVAVTNVMAGINTDSNVAGRADVNGDGQVGIGDIVAITDVMARGNTASARP